MLRHSKQVPKPLNGQACVLDDAAHRESVDRIVPRDGENTRAVTHHDVLAAPHYAKACLL